MGRRAPDADRAAGLYILLRLGFGLALLGVAAAAVLRGEVHVRAARVVYPLAAALFAVMGVSAALLPRFGRRPWYPWSQVALDAGFAAALTVVGGGLSSPFVTLFFLNIVASVWLLPEWGPVAVAAMDVVAYVAAMAAAGQLTREPAEEQLLVTTQILLHVFGFFLVGLLSAVLAARFRAVREELVVQRREALRLRALHGVVLDSLGSGVLLVDNDGVVLDLNPAARRLFGDAEGREITEMLRPSGDTWERGVESAGGQARQVLCSRSPLPHGGELVLVEDVTRLREVEAELAREERLAAVGRLAAGLAHEIRNPLASLSGAVQLLRQDHPDPLHDIVLNEVQRLNRLVEELLDTARPVSLRRVPLDLGALVEEVLTAFRHDERFASRRVSLEVEEGLPRVPADGEKVRQVLWNLLLNAGQATRPGGRIDVAVEGVEDEDAVAIVVTDDGEGISPDRLPRIFDPFHTTRDGGSGLGLASVDRIVRAHGGRVEVRSAPGRGSTFTVIFPVSPEEE